MLILLTFYLLENDRRSVETSFLSLFLSLKKKKLTWLPERLRNSSISIGKHSNSGDADTAVKWFQHCWEQTFEASLPHSVPNPGEGPRGPHPLPLISIPNWGPKGPKKFFFFFEERPSPRPPSFIKFWIRHWYCCQKSKSYADSLVQPKIRALKKLSWYKGWLVAL